MSKQMKTLTMPNGVTYEIVDDKARKDLVSLETGLKAEARRDCIAPITQTASGNPIAIDDSSSRPVRNLRLFGKTTQVVTTGKQLINLIAETKTNYGVTFTPNADGSVTINGTATANAYFIFDSENEIPVKETDLIVSMTGSSKVTLTVGYFKEDGTILNQLVAIKGGGQATFKYPAEAATTRSFLGVTAGDTVNAIVYPMIRLASIVDATHEPYTGGVASPSPDYPQELNSVENATVAVLGKNLLPYPYSFGSAVGAVESENGATFMNIGDGGVAFYGTPTAYAAVILTSTFKLLHDVSIALIGTYNNATLEVNVYSKDNMSLGGLANESGLTIRKSDYPEGSRLQIAIKRRVNDAAMTGIGYPIVVAGTEIPAEYERYVASKSMTINRTLHGIPVTSGGNYTDENGQQWICDEIDFERKVYIQRTCTETVTAEKITTIDNTYAATAGAIAYYSPMYPHVCVEDSCSAMSDFALGIASTERGNYPDIYRCYISDASSNYILFRYPVAKGTITYAGAREDFTGAKVTYILATPNEIPLTDEELAAFDALYTHKLNTTVLNNQDAWMDIEYSADLQTYIDRNAGAPSAERIENAVNNYLQNNPVTAGSTAAIGTVNLLASKWVARSNSLYSQVVTVTGASVTKNSQVDLTPSVEQLVAFYEKDLTLVTEQDGGVVTVYAIGQKPANDYSIQVTVTEVKR